MRAKRSLGQNFLTDPNVQRRIVAALEAGPADEVLEIGPGRGALTRHLAGAVGHLTLVELDDLLAAALAEEYAGRGDVTVVHDDFLRVPLADRVPAPERLLVVGNIPYNITTPIVFHLLERPRPARILLMVQKEVGERITARPGTGDYGALAVGVQSVAAARRRFLVPRRAFRPMPRVDSVIVELTPHAPPELPVHDELKLRALTRALFQWRRKQLGTTLRDHPDLGVPRPQAEAIAHRLGIDLVSRPETLDPPTLLALARALDP